MKDGLRGLISKDKLFEVNKKELLTESQETVKELQCFKDLDNKSFKECEIKLKEKLLSLIEAKDVDIGYAKGFLDVLRMIHLNIDKFNEAADLINGRI